MRATHWSLRARLKPWRKNVFPMQRSNPVCVSGLPIVVSTVSRCWSCLHCFLWSVFSSIHFSTVWCCRLIRLMVVERWPITASSSPILIFTRPSARHSGWRFRWHWSVFCLQSRLPCVCGWCASSAFWRRSSCCPWHWVQCWLPKGFWIIWDHRVGSAAVWSLSALSRIRSNSPTTIGACSPR